MPGKIKSKSNEDQMAKAQIKLGVGLDIGTMNCISARYGENGKIIFRRVRDAFLELDKDAEKSLRFSKADYINFSHQSGEETLLIVGDSALELANVLKKEAQRPLSRGVLSPGELNGQAVLNRLLYGILNHGDALDGEGEHCYYSVPAAPIDNPDQDIIYHTEIFRKILHELGYTPHPMNEAMAIIYSQCTLENFSGLSVSLGAGMCNIALSIQGIKGLEFAVARGGDWVDLHSSKATGKTASQMCSIKEKGVDLLKPQSREQEAIVLYLRALIRYCLDNIAAQFKKVQNSVTLPGPIPFVVSGGTSLANGFMQVFQDEFDSVKKRGFPIEISEVRAARDPMTAVAEGMLVLAEQEY
jgi:hypothetical protein